MTSEDGQERGGVWPIERKVCGATIDVYLAVYLKLLDNLLLVGRNPYSLIHFLRPDLCCYRKKLIFL